jgi:hypothetical protein
VERWEGYDSFQMDIKEPQGFITTLKEVLTQSPHLLLVA